MNDQLDYDGAVDALRDAGYSRKDAEKCVDGWQDEWKDYFHE